MTNEEILGLFPEHEMVRRADIEPFLNDWLENSDNYHELWDKVFERVVKLYPKPMGFFSDPKNKAWHDYFYGQIDRESFEFVGEYVAKWVGVLEDEYILRHGRKHTFDEACRIAAEEWCSMCFGDHSQDNGDRSVTGHIGNAMATYAADLYKRGLTSEMRDKAKGLIYEYYKGGCMYEYEHERLGKGKIHVILSVDYHPCVPLAEILKNAGVGERAADLICPIKTSISIDKKDFSVAVRGYGRIEYL